MVNKKEAVCYESDSSEIDGKVGKVIIPNDIKEIQVIINNSNLDICPRGSGTGLSGGCVPNESLVLDLSKIDFITNLSLSKKTVKVGCGITLKELNEKLEPYGYEFPIDPANRGISSIGGMIATNASGDRSFKYGRMREWIEEIEYINGRGEVIKTSKADLNDVCGMEGLTGVIVSATLKISPIINRSASAFQTNDLKELLNISRKLKSEKSIVILELFSPIVSRLIGLPEKYNLIVEFNSDRGKIKGNEYDEIVKYRENIYYTMYKENYLISEDPKFFYDKLEDFITFLDDNRIPYIGHMGEGVVIPFFKKNETKLREETINLMMKMKATSGKYGIGLIRKYYIDGFSKKIIYRVKLRHDPFMKMNKGKFVDNFEGVIHKREKESLKNDGVNGVNEGEDMTSKEVINRIKDDESRINESRIMESKVMKLGPLQRMNDLIKEADEAQNQKEVDLNEDDDKKVYTLGEDVRNEMISSKGGYKEEVSRELVEKVKRDEEKRNFIEDFDNEEIHERIKEDDIKVKESVEGIIDFKKEQEEINKERLKRESYEKVFTKVGGEYEIEKSEDDRSEVIKKINEDDNEIVNQEAIRVIEDYEQTYKSELGEEQVKGIENYAKNISKNIVHNEIPRNEIPRNEIPRDPIVSKREKVPVDYGAIQNIMTGKTSGFGEETPEKFREKGIPMKDDEGVGKVTMTNDLGSGDKKGSKSKIDIDLIDRIMTNRSGKDSGSEDGSDMGDKKNE
ncbi:FAD-binding protein [Candidatus Pacearchaeota archaeon]|nr:FAD-binding protein [Candidatus Pacearchaeota archaeon]